MHHGRWGGPVVLAKGAQLGYFPSIVLTSFKQT